jgi:hypothetical protein
LFTIAFTTFPLWGKFTEKAFTERGYLWIFARSEFHDVGLIGFGPSYWTHLGTSMGFPSNYGTHNMWMDVIIGFGYFGLIIFIWILSSLKKNLKEVSVFLIFVSLIFSGMNESTFILWKLYPNSILLLTLLMITNTGSSRHDSAMREINHASKK